MKRSVGKSALIIFGVIIALLCGVVAWWVASAYPADATALAAIADEDGPADGVSVRTLADGSIAFVADDPIAGMVFYPGAGSRGVRAAAHPVRARGYHLRAGEAAAQRCTARR